MNRPFPSQNSSKTSLLPGPVQRQGSLPPSGRPVPPSAQPAQPAQPGPQNSRGPPSLMRKPVPLPIADVGGRSSSGHPSSLSEKYSLAPSPASWNMPLTMGVPEPDDFLHNPDPKRDRKNDAGGSILTLRGLSNLGCLSILALGCLMLFAGYPLLTHFLTPKLTTQGGFNLGGINASGQIPDLPGNFGLIDKDTPRSAYTKRSYMEDEDLVLVFSDEFNQDGRTFYPGDDPFWEAVDLHYWVTDNLEWYDPSSVTTRDGYLDITLSEVDDPSTNHDMRWKSGMIQTWNKFCFTGGLFEASVRLPGESDVSGLWPAVWSMGNLGRAGFGATTDGTWPFSYDDCDVGTLPNQTYPDGQTPILALTEGDGEVGGVLSYLPGQRLSACTCPGESHPGPVRRDGRYVGRAAPEIDVLEATVIDGVGEVSLSAQWAPFNARYQAVIDNTTTTFHDPTRTHLNIYRGGRYQQTTSGLSRTNPDCYERGGTRCFALYGFEYKSGFDDGYITWINEVQDWTLYSSALVGDTGTEIGQRIIPLEPMYLIVNLGISEGFGTIDENLVTPVTMHVDYIRIYQRRSEIKIGCDPKDFPTAKYIERYIEAYTNSNLTTWEQYGEPWPKNELMPGNENCRSGN